MKEHRLRIVLGMKSYKELEKLCNRYFIDIDRCKLSRDRFSIEFESVYDGRWGQYLEKEGICWNSLNPPINIQCFIKVLLIAGLYQFKYSL